MEIARSDNISRRCLVFGAAALCAIGNDNTEAAEKLGSNDLAVTKPRTGDFSFSDLLDRAQEQARKPYMVAQPAPPSAIKSLSYDAYREIQFRREKAFLSEAGAFRLHLFHLGYLFTAPVTINIQRGGVFVPIPYARNLFEFGKNNMTGKSDVNMGFAGFKLTYPLEQADKGDEIASFLGASYFRVLASGQRYGISARALAISTIGDEKEEFPSFREFWIFQPKADDRSIKIFALLDSPSTTGAYEFEIAPGAITTVDTKLVLFPRVALGNIGIAPFSSMYFYDENDQKPAGDFRPEVHDSDGLQIHRADDEWVWQPLKRTGSARISRSPASNSRGFGLFQRDRLFEHYEDLEAVYQRRPSYWVEPSNPWGNGSIDLLELPTADETHDNVVAFWRPDQTYPPQTPVEFSYRLTATSDGVHPLARAVNTFEVGANLTHSSRGRDSDAYRVLVDFEGEALAALGPELKGLDIVTDSGPTNVVSSRLVWNPENKRVRAILDFRFGEKTAKVSAYLRADGQKLSETWHYVLGA